MPEMLEDFLMTRPPTAERPLLGQTVLVVEDSRYACEALRMICQRSGARIRRADSLKSAARHLRTYRPGIVLVDVGLPDGSGLDLIRQLADSEPKIDVIMAMSGDDTVSTEALAAGAHAFIAKPINSVTAFIQAVLSELPRSARPTTVRMMASDLVLPDRIALRDDLSLASELMRPTPDEATLDYLKVFLMGLAKISDDPELGRLSDALTKAREAGAALAEPLSRLRSGLDQRLAAEQHV